MKTYGRLYDQICSFKNLLAASRDAKRGRTSREYVQHFECHRERELLKLRDELLSGSYCPGPYKEFYILEPKYRMISAAPYRDRVVHHALCNIIEPLFERSFIYDSYANRAGKGVHRAVDRYQYFACKYPFVLKCDIRKYFPSIDHDILKNIVRRRIACERTLLLIDTIINNSNPQEQVRDYYPGDDLFTPLERRRGLPIGNLTSQFLANVYLDGFDHFVTEKLHCEGYMRYVDDFVMFSDTKERLHNLRGAIAERLATLRLTLHEDKSLVHRTQGGVQFLGYRVFPDYRLLLHGAKVRYRRKLKRLTQQYHKGEVPLSRVRASIHGWLGHAVKAQTYRLRRQVLSEAVFSTG